MAKKNMSNSRPGNQNAKKLNTPELKKMAYEQYCAHIAAGKHKKSWCFKHPDLLLTWETMEKYIAQDREFDPIHREIALAQGYQVWEEKVANCADGINKDANVAALQMIMRNKYKWDRTEDRREAEGFKPQAQKLLEIWSE